MARTGNNSCPTRSVSATGTTPSRIAVQQAMAPGNNKKMSLFATSVGANNSGRDATAVAALEEAKKHMMQAWKDLVTTLPPDDKPLKASKNPRNAISKVSR